jgi:hypothetical protein
MSQNPKTYLSCFLAAALLPTFISDAQSAEWKPAKGRLETPWTKDVSPTNALPDYPRPQLVRPDWVNLNGLWQYAVQPSDDEQPTTWQGEILVPYPIESALSGVMKRVQPDERLWYRRTFERPKLADGCRLLLHFGAVDWKCTAWVNGKEVGQHTGGYDPFTFDVTDALQDGENELVVAVTDPTNQGGQPRGKQDLNPHGIWYTPVTGIWQTAWLEPVPAKYVSSLKITPRVDDDALEVIVNPSDAAKSSRVRITASDQGKQFAQQEGQVGEAISIPMQDAKLWSPDSPQLYDLKVELLNGDQVVDQVDSYFAMRKIEVAKDDQGILRLMLNGQPLFQYGPLDQGWWPDGLYTPPTDAALKYDVEMTKKFGMNMARKHVKVEPARWYYWCDKLGLLVWQDMPSGNLDKDDESRANYRRELQAMIDALYNVPSIVMWVPFNEGWGQHETPEVVAWLEKYDPTRPVNEASGWHDRGSGTISDMHNYPGPGMRPVEEKRVSVLGEFGGLGMPLPGHTWQDEKNWGYVSYKTSEELTDAYVKLLTAMRPLIGQGLSAAVYTQTSDVEIEVNGIMTYDRQKVKMDLDRIAEVARKLYGTPPQVAVVALTSETKPQTWRYATEKPADEWFAVDFDDAAWQEGPGGFGTKRTPGAIVGTEWNGSNIWLRREFSLDEVPAGEIFLRLHHDDAVEVYINGQLAAKRSGHVGNYELILADNSKGESLLRKGRNVIAVHCHQDRGGQFIDVGVMSVHEQPRSASADRKPTK